MIIKSEKEVLANAEGKTLEVMDSYINKAEEMSFYWDEYKAVPKGSFPILPLFATMYPATGLSIPPDSSSMERALVASGVPPGPGVTSE